MRNTGRCPWCRMKKTRNRNLFWSLFGGNKGVEDKRIKELTQGGQVVPELNFAVDGGSEEQPAFQEKK